MNATMSEMELIEADTLTPDQLMIGDLIKVNGDILEVTFIESDSTGDNYDIQTENEFGEREVTQYSYTDEIPLYVFIEEDEQEKYFYALPRIKMRRLRRRVACEIYHNYVV